MNDEAMRDCAFDAVEVHHGFEDGRQRIAIRSFLGGSFILWELVPKSSWNDVYWEKRGICYITSEAREWVGEL